nr:MAG TPA: Ead/Ea22-like protein [Caudoviricetes sp.]
MTTDITELAQSLKAAANTTSAAIDRLKAFPSDELIDLSQHEGEQVDIDIATLNQWYELSSPANILALVEALEHYKSREERVTSLVRNNSKSWDELYRQVEAKGKRNVELVEALEKAQQRIAELESRTVTFKLPFTPEPSAFAPWAAKAFYQFHKDTVKSCVAVFSDACAAAGIKVEAK